MHSLVPDGDSLTREAVIPEVKQHGLARWYALYIGLSAVAMCR